MNRRFGFMILVSVLIVFFNTGFSVPQEEETGTESADRLEELEKVHKTLEEIDIDKIVENALRAASIGLKQAKIQEHVHETIAGLDIDSIVAEALEAAEEGIRQANVSEQIRVSIDSVQIDQIVEEALKEMELSLQQMDLESTINEALSQIDFEELADQLERREESLDSKDEEKRPL